MVYLIIIYDQLYPVLSHYLGEGSVWVRARSPSPPSAPLHTRGHIIVPSSFRLCAVWNMSRVFSDESGALLALDQLPSPLSPSLP